MTRIFGAVLVTALLFSATALAVKVPDSARQSGAEDHVEGRLIFDRDLKRVGVLFDVIPDWHIYWKNPGESGLETRIQFAGAKVDGELQFETPTVFVDPSQTINTFAFANQTLMWVDVHEPKENIAASVSFLVCKVECIPGNLKLVRGTTELGSEEEFRLFEKFTANSPRLAANVEVLRHDPITPNDEVDLTVHVDCDRCTPRETFNATYYFVPDAGGVAQWKTTSVFETQKGIGLKLRARATPDEITDCRLRGIVPHKAGAVSIDVPLNCGDAVPDSAEPKEPTSFVWILLLGLLGGLILNLMPCVFPVLAIKVGALLEMTDKSRSKTLAHAGAYTAGIVCSMIALAVSIITLRTFGVAVGWGFQFQEPVFVCVMFVVMVAFALNLFGVYEFVVSVSVRSERTGLAKSFGEGVLSVVLATPCSAPILGTAVGFAFAGTPLEITTVFVAIGLGLASPFVVLALIPGWHEKLPRPGPWMDRIKQALGVALIATSVWLLWVLVRATGWTSLIVSLGWAVAITGALIYFGRTQFEHRRGLNAIGLVVVAGFTASLFFPFEEPAPQPLEGGWIAWSPEAVETHRSNGAIIFVDFTADWCITCKVNENGVLKSETVVEVFESRNVLKMKGDWTRRDEVIRKELQRHGRAGVPLYLVISDAEEVLPEILIESELVDAIERAHQSTSRN